MGCRRAGKSSLAASLVREFDGDIKAVEVTQDEGWMEEAAAQMGVLENIKLLEEWRLSVEEVQRRNAEKAAQAEQEEKANDEEEGVEEEEMPRMPERIRTTPDCHYLLVGPTVEDVEKWKEKCGMAIGMVLLMDGEDDDEVIEVIRERMEEVVKEEVEAGGEEDVEDEEGGDDVEEQQRLEVGQWYR